MSPCIVRDLQRHKTNRYVHEYTSGDLGQLPHVIMEAEKSHSRSSSSHRPEMLIVWFRLRLRASDPGTTVT